LAALTATWSKIGDKDGWLASRYFDLVRDRSSASDVDDKTWSDLEFPKIFSDLDTTVTPIGAQTLFRKLRAYVDDPKLLISQYRDYQQLRANASLREQIQLKLARLDADSHADIANYVFGLPPDKPRAHRLVLLWSAVSIATPIAVFAFSLPPQFWLFVVATNYVVFNVSGAHIDRDARALKGCMRLLSTANSLGTIVTAPTYLRPLAELAKEKTMRRQAQRAFVLFHICQETLLLGTLSTFLNVFFLVELVTYIHVVGRFAHFRSVFQSTFTLVGALDASIAVASFLERCPQHCTPSFAEDSAIDLEEAYHPLLAQPVKNSIQLDRRSALVTGSNMAGKTTFIKMVAVNVILARTLGFCLASRATVPWAKVMASIGGHHSVESGKSHYFAEVEAILSFIGSAQRGERTVLVIDELFSGTNTIERIAAARAVLEFLSASAQVLVTTHDVELQDDLMDRFDLYHFQENLEVEGYFDYRLRRGAANERNAIRLLERMGFPDDIVRKAMTFALTNRGSCPSSSQRVERESRDSSPDDH
jgi:hypothetical protein